MKISDEIRMEIVELKNQIETLQKEENYKDALQVADKLDKKLDQLKIEVAKEKAEFDEFMKDAMNGNVYKIIPNPPEDSAKLRISAFNKLVLNPLRGEFRVPLTDEEKNAYFNVSGSPGTPAQIGATPTEQMGKLQEFRKDFVALKDYVNVVNTNYTSGRWATYTQQDLEFQNFTEMTDIPESDITFAEATYTIADRGLIIPVSNMLIDDVNIDIISFMGRQLAEGAVLTENKEILKPLNTLIEGDTSTGVAAATTITSYKSLNTALFKTLDGVYYPASKIFTNQDGFLWLANLDDGQNRPLLQPNVTEPNKYFYRGKEIVVLPNLTLPNTTISNKNYAPFFVGDLRSYLTFFERAGMELTTSSELYFRKAGTALRAIIRFGVTVTDKDAMTALKVEI